MSRVPVPFRIAVVYAIVGAAWILCSDWLVGHLPRGELITEAQTIKGLLFIAVTAGLIHWLVARAVRALRRSETQARELFESCPDAQFVISEEGRIFEANQVAIERYGRSRDELRAMAFSDLAVPALRDRVDQWLSEAQGGSVRWESRHLLAGGGELPVEVHACPIEREGRRCILNSVRDVSEHRRAERELQEKEALLRVAGEMAKVGGWEFDVATLRGTWTDEVARIHDLDPGGETSVEMGLSFFHGESRAKIESAIHNAIERGEPYDLEVEMISAKGVSKWVRTIGRPVQEGGRVVKIRGTLQDITEQRIAEEALRTSEAHLSNAVEIAQLGYWEYDVATALFSFDDHFYALFHTTAEEVGGYTMVPSRYAEEFVHPDDSRVIAEEMRKAIGTTDPHFSRQLEHRIVYADGGVGHIAVRFFIVKDSAGRTIKTYGANQDITERKRIEEDLQRRVANLQILNELNRVFLSATDLASVVDQVYRIFPQLLSAHGVHRASVLLYDRETDCLISDQLIGVERSGGLSRSVPQEISHSISGRCFKERRPIVIADCAESDLIPPDTVESLSLRSAAAVPILCGDEPLGVLRLDNTQEPVGFSEDEVALFSLVAGHLGIVIRSVQLVAERLRAERALARTDERLRVAVEGANLGLWDWDLQTNRVFFSPEWKRQIGHGEHEISDDLSEWESRVHPDDLPRTREMIQAFIRSPWTNYEVEYRFRHRDGSHLRVLSRAALIRDETGKPLRMVGCHLDITKRKEMEEQLRQSQKMDAIGQLAGGVAHDFNNLLLAILGYSDIAASDLEEGDDRLECLREIHLAGERAASLTRQLLAFSRQQAIEPLPLALNDLISGLMRMLRRLIPESCPIRFRPDHEIGAIVADRGQIEQVVLNLCVNARDAMPEGGKITISTERVALDAEDCRAHPWAKEGLFARLTVRDTGVGMSPEVLRRIFEPFFTTKEQGRGTGLGLATVFGIVQQHGGLIDVESQPGQGSAFHIYLPIAALEVVERLSAEQGEPTGGTETVLVAEDEEHVRRLTTRILERAGYLVITASDGPQAVKVFEANADRIDIVLLDMIMPGMNGLRVREALESTCPDVRVLFTSGYNPETIDVDDLAREGIDLLPKPYEAKTLLRRIRARLDG
jgi:two-component system, cell cycle sensor histidine kinase and response regulator CckA